MPDPTRPLDLDAIRAEWLRQCGPHDYGVDTAGCTCPAGDPRPVIMRLADEVERQRDIERHRACLAAQVGKVRAVLDDWRQARRHMADHNPIAELFDRLDAALSVPDTNPTEEATNG